MMRTMIAKACMSFLCGGWLLSAAANAHWTYSLNGISWPADKRAAITSAMDSAVAIDNANGYLPKSLTANYNSGVPTARIRHVKMVSAMRRDMGIVSDSDGDGIPNDWEMFHFGILSQADTDPNESLPFQWSGSLAATSWSRSGVTKSVLSDDGVRQTLKAPVPASISGRRFVRLKASRP